MHNFNLSKINFKIFVKNNFKGYMQKVFISYITVYSLSKMQSPHHFRILMPKTNSFDFESHFESLVLSFENKLNVTQYQSIQELVVGWQEQKVEINWKQIDEALEL